jgi:hypothetical protein
MLSRGHSWSFTRVGYFFPSWISENILQLTQATKQEMVMELLTTMEFVTAKKNIIQHIWSCG